MGGCSALQLCSQLHNPYVVAVASNVGLRERKNARTREAIERAALELALEQGFDRTTVDQIAARADVSPRTVFVRYPTKDAIVFGDPEASAAGFERWLAGFEDWLDDADGDLVERLVDYVAARTEAARAQSELEQLRRRALLGDPYLRRALRGLLDTAEQAIAERLAESLALPPDDSGPKVFAAAIVGLMLAMANDAVAGSDGDSGGGLTFVRAGLEALRASGGR
jgi:AcrR family transcriptional regulator